MPEINSPSKSITRRAARQDALKEYNLNLTFRIPHIKYRDWWAARLKFSISLGNFKILNFFQSLGP